MCSDERTYCLRVYWESNRIGEVMVKAVLCEDVLRLGSSLKDEGGIMEGKREFELGLEGGR